jgi:quercetin dioxygenase-like cupin family protein
MDQFIPVPPRKAVISRADDLRWSAFAGERVAIRVSGAETGGHYAIIEAVLGSMTGPPLHQHANEDEVIEVLEGRLRFVVGEKSFDAAAGAIVVIPKGVPHTWRNLTDTPVHARAFLTPAGLERMFVEFHGRAIEELEAIAHRYGTVFVGPPIPA